MQRAVGRRSVAEPLVVLGVARESGPRPHDGSTHKVWAGFVKDRGP